MSNIPISQVVTINPGVVGTGGNPLALNAIMQSNNAIAPWGSLQQFSQASDVGAYYGTGSTEYALAQIYFAAFDNSTKKPLTLFVTAYAQSARAAFLMGTSLAGMTLAQLQAVTGSLSVTIDGSVKTYASVNLAAATSFTNAASLLATGLSLAGGQTCTWNATTSKFQITSGTTGTSSTITQGTGTAALSLGLAAGQLSQGAAIDTPAGAMARLAGYSLNWATMFTAFEPVQSDKLLFANWFTGQNDRYAYIMWDSDPNIAVANTATTTGAQLAALATDGTVCVYNTASIAAFVAGCAAATDWNATEGRINYSFRTQAGLATTVSDLTTATAVLSNFYSYYGAYAASGQSNTYNFLYNGQMVGRWKWFDTYMNQVFLNSQLQLGIINGLMSVNSAPYNELGNTYIRSWCLPAIQQALNNGSIRTGVTLSASQIAQVNAQAGKDISSELFNKGYFLLIGTATSQVRGARQSPPLTFWYCDGGSINQITLPSLAIM